ncbi:3881_t:CDS:2, partial [Funneliformis caledonium]
MTNNLDLIKNQKQNDDIITFETNTGHSMIDHIFMHSSLIPDLIDQTVEKVDKDLSDHAIVYATILLTSINPSFTQYAAIKKLVFRYDEMSEDAAIKIIPNKYTLIHHRDLRP